MRSIRSLALVFAGLSGLAPLAGCAPPAGPTGGPSPARGDTLTVAQMAELPLPVLEAGQTVRGALEAHDLVRRDDGTRADAFFYNGREGERITITLRSSDFDSWVVLDDPDGPMREYDDDGAGGNDSRLSVTLPRTGRYLVLANSVSPGATGAYTLRVDRTP